MKAIIKAVSAKMQEAGIDFCMGRKKSKKQYPYFVGQLYLATPPDESGKTEYELLIDGFGREDELALIGATEVIEGIFDPISGYVAGLEDGVAAIFFDTVIPDIPTGEDVELNRNQSRLKIKYWKGR